MTVFFLFIALWSARVVSADEVSRALDRYEKAARREGPQLKDTAVKNLLDLTEARSSPVPGASAGTPGRRKKGVAARRSSHASAAEDNPRTVPPRAEEKVKAIQTGEGASPVPKNSVWETRWDCSTGWRYDDLRWNIAGTSAGTSPNILSELTWTDLWSYQVRGHAELTFRKRWRLEGTMGYGWIYQGENQDSDYLGNDRTFEFSRSNNASDGDNVSDWAVGFGYQQRLSEFTELLADDLWVAWLAGYSGHRQNLTMTDGFQTIPASGPFGGLNSTYQSEWLGPWVGIELQGRRENFFGLFRMEHHWADYDAEADWNLRSDFAHPVSFAHTATGSGNIISLGLGYILNERWSLRLRGELARWETNAGTDQTFFSNGTTARTRLNEVVWDSYALTLGATFSFSD